MAAWDSHPWEIADFHGVLSLALRMAGQCHERWNRQDQRRSPAGFWTSAEIERSAHNHPQTRKFFDKCTRQNLKSKSGGRLKFLSVNGVCRLKKGQVPTTRIEEVYGKIREVITLLTPLAESQPETIEETVLKSRFLKSKFKKPVPRQPYLPPSPNPKQRQQFPCFLF